MTIQKIQSENHFESDYLLYIEFQDEFDSFEIAFNSEECGEDISDGWKVAERILSLWPVGTKGHLRHFERGSQWAGIVISPNVVAGRFVIEKKQPRLN